MDDAAKQEELPPEVHERLPRRVWRRMEEHPLLTVATLALVVRLCVLLLVHLFLDGTFAGDDSTYSNMAKDVATGGQVGWTISDFQLYRTTYAFTGAIAFLYEVFGPHEVVGQLYVALLGVATATLTARLAREVVSTRLALLAGVIMAFLPSQILWSSIMLKDVAVWICLVGLGLLTALASKRQGRQLILLLVATGAVLVALAHTREHTFLVACFALCMVSPFIGNRSTRVARTTVALAFTMLIPSWLGSGPAGYFLITDGPSLARRRLNNAAGARTAFIEEYVDYIADHPEVEALANPESVDDPEAVSRELTFVRERIVLVEDDLGISHKGSGGEPASDDPTSITSPEPKKDREIQVTPELQALYVRESNLELLLENLLSQGRPIHVTKPLENIEVENGFSSNIAYLPKGMYVLLLEPLPWKSGDSLGYNLARLESLIWYPLLLLALVGLIPARKHLDVMAFPILAGAGVLVVYALTEGNIGTAFRHRGEAVWVVVLLAVMGISEIIRRRRGLPELQ